MLCVLLITPRARRIGSRNAAVQRQLSDCCVLCVTGVTSAPFEAERHELKGSSSFVATAAAGGGEGKMYACALFDCFLGSCHTS